MGDTSDKAVGRLKQAGGALTGDDELQHEGERQETKGKVKETLDDAVDKAQDAAERLREKVQGH